MVYSKLQNILEKTQQIFFNSCRQKHRKFLFYHFPYPQFFSTFLEALGTSRTSAVRALSVMMNTRMEQEVKGKTVTRRMPRIIRNRQYKKTCSQIQVSN